MLLVHRFIHHSFVYRSVHRRLKKRLYMFTAEFVSVINSFNPRIAHLRAYYPHSLDPFLENVHVRGILG